MKNILREKSYSFAVRVVNISKQLTARRKEFVLSKQLLRAGTSIGANITEAQGGIQRLIFRPNCQLPTKKL